MINNEFKGLNCVLHLVRAVAGLLTFILVNIFMDVQTIFMSQC